MGTASKVAASAVNVSDSRPSSWICMVDRLCPSSELNLPAPRRHCRLVVRLEVLGQSDHAIELV
jgi:hypothetical protein